MCIVNNICTYVLRESVRESIKYSKNAPDFLTLEYQLIICVKKRYWH